ncbi:putative Membrane-bound lytic murein transglycosylase B [Magnetospirillum sp. LM-5]|uniref:lytic murein transglycosylase n=1 Tax=Magnetospirillum sp. LM-5 TaxID=2681466 RepID=UPI00137E4380|nr:lytic murein transglycosylase [Magnetospirillum sp. LM-5]CAA7613370.1 putative Membrane-bound lytic murein transglycosylase B [Magnetospirillum sp. LM-5]
MRILVAALLVVGSLGPAMAQEPARDFQTWLKEVERDALAQGIKAETVETALSGIQHIDKVVELDRRQPEFTITYQQYIDRVLTPSKIERGRKLLAEHRAVLSEIERRYHVQSKYVVALWGIETDFGRVTGGYPVVSALATLGFDGRRSAYFRGELMNALKILDEGHISPQAMLGSWAGAMGQCQFMPSSFLRFAEDWDGDGRRDIWGTKPDVFASASNYLLRSGWNGDETWGRAVTLPKGFDTRLIGLDTRKSLAEWSALGLTAANGKKLPKADLQASVIYAENGKGPTFLVYENFRTILKWNRSTYFALAVGHLAERIGAK